jgi:N-acetylglutamate synthase/N-acetylornithine aminotransferase
MATMLVFITTDAAVTPAMLQKALSETCRKLST